MSEETKLPNDEEAENPQVTPEQETPPVQEGTEQPEKGGKSKKESKKKGKTYTLTQDQMEAAELAAKQLEAAKEQFVRLTAEYENFRKRTAKEKDALYQDAKADTIQAFLAVYDNLERAAQSEDDSASPHKKGLDMIFNQYKEVLTQLGVTEIEALGQPFDPERHNAVMHVDDDSLGENVVSDVFQSGFMMGDKILRFSTVRVAN